MRDPLNHVGKWHDYFLLFTSILFEGVGKYLPPEEKVCSLCRCLPVIMNDDAMSCAACDASSGVYRSIHSGFRVRNSAQVLSYTLDSRRKLEHLFL